MRQNRRARTLHATAAAQPQWVRARGFMAVEAEEDELELGEEQELDDDNQDETETEKPESEEEDEGDEETVVSFGDEAAPASGDGETPLIKHLRTELRETKREIAELRKGSQPQAIEVGPKPTLADCDYDEDAFEAKLDQWKDRAAKAKEAETEADRTSRELNEEYQRSLRSYHDGKAKLGFADVDEAEETVTALLSKDQQNVILLTADNPSMVIYALAKHPAKLEQIAQTKNPLKLAAAVAKLEGTLKVTTRKKARFRQGFRGLR
jgi:hypothetical protein